MPAYYNEFDPKAAAWLRELVAAGHIAPGDVDERDIRDVNPDELRAYDQCHFFAGIGGWSLALRRSGWPDDRPVWTGSCPCQPFSAAGKRGGTADERHLWPAFFHLIDQCRPPVVFGEQVASKDGLGWFDLVSADLEGSGYSVGAADLCAASVGAPHIRQRLWFVGVADAERFAHRAQEQTADPRKQKTNRSPDRASGRCVSLGPLEHAAGDGRLERRAGADGRSAASGRGLGGLADRDDAGLEGRGQPGRERAAERAAGPDGVAGGLADAHDAERGPEAAGGDDSRGQDTGRPQGSGDAQGRGGDGRPGPVNGVWRDADWLYCRDGKWRPVEPSAQQMVNGLPEGLGHLRLERDGENEGGTTSETDPDQTLPRLRGEAGTQEVQRHAGGSERLQETGLLRPEVHGAGLRGPDQGAERQELAAAVGEGTETRVRAVRKGSAPRSPQGLEPGEQHADEPREPLRFLSQAGTPPPGYFPLASGVRHRVGLLRGYGNAISPEAAQAFIEAYLDIDTLDINPGNA